MKNQEHLTIQNFISSIDTKMPMIDHFRNCLRDAMLYKWSSAIVVPIMEAIEDIYKKKDK